MKQSIVILLFTITCKTLLSSSFEYPFVRRAESISDNFFGTEVKDPYRWLENPDTPQRQKFIDEQNAVTRVYIELNKDRDTIKNSLTNLYDNSRFSTPSKHGSKYYILINTGLEDNSIVYSMDSLYGEPKVFIDPNQLSSDGTISLQFLEFSKNGQYCAYATSKSGSDWMTINVKIVETGQDLNDTLTRVRYSSAEWTHDNLGFFYGQYDEHTGTGEGTDPDVNLKQKIYYHRINTPQSSDVMIVQISNNDKLVLGDPIVSDDGNYLHLFPSVGTTENMWYWAYIKDNPLDREIKMNVIIDIEDAEYDFITNDANYAYVMTNKEAPLYRLIRVNLNCPAERNWITLIQEPNAVLTDVIAVNGDYFAALFMRDVKNYISIHRIADGSKVTDVQIPIGTISEMSGHRNDTEMFIAFGSFLVPKIVYHYNFTSNQITIFKEAKIKGFDSTEYITNQVFYRSKDDTVDVPMFIVHHNSIKLDGNNPTFLKAYGGFNVNIMPGYEPLATFFIRDLKGVYAVANIRGGGEYGDSWHRGGQLLNKQNVFDDFASAAEYLITENYTSRESLTINGRSNGGLLAGASANQRPDLFGCSIVEVGVLDMLRFHKFTIGYAWIEEYGNPEEETHFKNIIKYSPLHNIPSNATQYPSILVLTGDHDDRVVPAHSLKFISELQYTLGNTLPNIPLMIRIDTNSGHSSGKTTSKIIEERTDVLAFIINSLQLNYSSSCD